MANEVNEIITLKSIYSKDRRLVIQPVFDSKSRWYLGVPRLSEEQKKGLEFWTEPESKLEITNNYTFNLADPVDQANWKWAQHCPGIAGSFEECQKSKDALFYVDNEELESQKALDSDDVLLEALTFIKKDRDDMLANRARLMGYDMEGDTPKTIRAFLNKLAKDPKTVQKVLSCYTSNSVAIHLLFLKSRDKDIIKQENGAFIYGSSVLGVTEEAVITSLQDPVNSELVKEIEKELNAKKKK